MHVEEPRWCRGSLIKWLPGRWLSCNHIDYPMSDCPDEPDEHAIWVETMALIIDEDGCISERTHNTLRFCEEHPAEKVYQYREVT